MAKSICETSLIQILFLTSISINHSLYLHVKIGVYMVLFIIILYPNCEINWFFRERLRGSPPYLSKIETRMLNALVKISNAKHIMPDTILMLKLSYNSSKSSSSSNWLSELKLTLIIFSNPNIISFEVVLNHLVEFEKTSKILLGWDMLLGNME